MKRTGRYRKAREYLERVQKADNQAEKLEMRMENLRVLATDTANHLNGGTTGGKAGGDRIGRITADCGYGAADHGGEGRSGANLAGGSGNGIEDRRSGVPEGDHDALSGIPDTAGNRGRNLLQPAPCIPGPGKRVC